MRPRSSWPTRSKPGVGWFVSCGGVGKGGVGVTGDDGGVELLGDDTLTHAGADGLAVEAPDCSPYDACAPEPCALGGGFVCSDFLGEGADDVRAGENRAGDGGAEGHGVGVADVDPEDVIDVEVVEDVADLWGC